MYDTKKDLKTLKILHMALVGGSSFYLVIAVMMNRLSGPISSPGEMMPVILLISTISSVSLIFAGFSLFRRRLAGISEKPLKEKMEIYRVAMIVRAGLVEAAAFIPVTFFLLTGNMILLLESVACVIILIMLVPSEFKVAADIGE